MHCGLQVVCVWLYLCLPNYSHICLRWLEVFTPWVERHFIIVIIWEHVYCPFNVLTSKLIVTVSAGKFKVSCLKSWVMLISLAILKCKVKFLILTIEVEAKVLNLSYLMHTKMFLVSA